MPDTKRLRNIIQRIREVAEEDVCSVVSLGVVPCCNLAEEEITAIEAQLGIEKTMTKTSVEAKAQNMYARFWHELWFGDPEKTLGQLKEEIAAGEAAEVPAAFYQLIDCPSADGSRETS